MISLHSLYYAIYDGNMEYEDFVDIVINKKYVIIPDKEAWLYELLGLKDKYKKEIIKNKLGMV